MTHRSPDLIAAPDAAADTPQSQVTRGPEPPSADNTPSSSRWILIADDNDPVRAVWAEALSGAGYRTIEARSGQIALDLMAAVVPDLIILDLCLPALSGDEVLQHLRRSPVLRSTPVLIVSGFLDSEPHDGFGLKIVGLLPKPLRLANLLDSVKAALKAGPPVLRPGIES